MADLTGQTLGKYQVLDRLGRGGMADVYTGYQPGLDRYVAIKVMHAHLSDDPSFITRFRREAKSVAELHHPDIVRMIAAVEEPCTSDDLARHIVTGRRAKTIEQAVAYVLEESPG